MSEYFALELSGKPPGAAATRDTGAKGQPKVSDNCMVASEKPEEMRSREIGRTLVNKGNWNYLQGWNKDESHFPCVWLPWWPAHLGHIPFHLVTFYRQPAACILKISITSEQLFLQQQSQEFPEASLSHAHLMRVHLETAGSSSCCVFKGWARPERSELHGRNKAVYKPPRQGRLKEWQQRRNVAPEPCSLLCLDLICWMWENHFNNFVPQCSDLTCLDNVIHQPQDRAAERNCCKELCIQPWAAPTGRRAASPTPPWQRTSRRHVSFLLWSYTYLHHKYESLSRNFHTQAKTWRKGSSQRKLGPVLLYGLLKLGSYSWGHRVSQSKSTRLGRQHFPVFVPNMCFSTVQNTFFLLLVTKKRRTNLLSLSKSLLLFT